MKKIACITLFCSFYLFTSAQQIEDMKINKTKFSDFTSQSGSIISFEDFNKETFVNENMQILTVKKRILKKANEQKIFLLFEILGSNRVAAISEDDISELFNAIITLQNDVSVDINTNSEFMEKYYETEDNFKIGYSIGNKKVNWYVDIDMRLGSSHFFIKDFDSFVTKLNVIMN